MRTIVVSNAFSLNMFPSDRENETMSFTKISDNNAREMVANADNILSIVGHADTARVFGNILGVDVVPNRVSYKMETQYKCSQSNPFPEETRVLLVGQYNGPRLEEGATTLPEGAHIDWWIVDYFWDYELI